MNKKTYSNASNTESNQEKSSNQDITETLLKHQEQQLKIHFKTCNEDIEQLEKVFTDKINLLHKDIKDTALKTLVFVFFMSLITVCILKLT